MGTAEAVAVSGEGHQRAPAPGAEFPVPRCHHTPKGGVTPRSCWIHQRDPAQGGSRGCPCARGRSDPSRWDHAVSPGQGEPYGPPGCAALSMT